MLVIGVSKGIGYVIVCELVGLGVDLLLVVCDEDYFE